MIKRVKLLKLTRETLANLNATRLSTVMGGEVSEAQSCWATDCYCPSYGGGECTGFCKGPDTH